MTKMTYCESNLATYCPEDNKLRLYVGRVPRDEYERLREEGWTATPKQGCDFVAIWTPQRKRTALEFADLIEDEDQGAEDRAADRAERFGEYRDKRTEEAGVLADRYDSQPMAHGFQSEARAERSAVRHDRIGSHAVDAWSKAEYWQRRTAGVINHALYVSSPSVRMGRIKTIEAEIRQIEARFTPNGSEIMQTNDSGKSVPYVWCGQGRGGYWVEKSRLPAIEAGSQEWIAHLNLRLAYENQMLEAQGGRAGDLEIVVGGFIGGRQIHKVNKSAVSGRVVSVHVKGPSVQGWCYKASNVPGTDYALYQIDTERLSPGAYRAPTSEELEAFEAEKKAAKKAAPKKEACPLINPTDGDAERLLAIWNAQGKARRDSEAKRKGWAEDYKPGVIRHITQAQYSQISGGTYSSSETRGIRRCGFRESNSNMYSQTEHEIAEKYGRPVCKIRISSGGGWYSAPSIIILTDKPQKPLPVAVFEALEVEVAP